MDFNIENKNEKAQEITSEQLEDLLKKERATGRGQGALITLAIVGVVAIITMGLISGLKSVTGYNKTVINSEMERKTSTLWSLINNKFLWPDDVDSKKAIDYMYKGMIASLGDQYSVYYTKEEFDDLMESYDGEYSGIGAYVTQDTETGICYISKPMANSPAEEAGLVPNDYIYEIDGESVAGEDLNLVVSKIKGPERTKVNIGVRHENQGEIETITVERRKIEVQMLDGEMLDDEIGYIHIEEVETPTLKQLNDKYDELISQGMKGLIIDLRDNPGGDLDIVAKMCDKFLDEGVIVYTKDRYGKKDYFKSDAECVKIPIVILVNGNTASAAEIFSGCLKDRGVATIVGTTTFGKGIVQSVRQLSDGSGIKMTESEYYLPNDECIHGVGITPDVEIKLDRDKYVEEGIDNQKDKAIEIMKEKLKK